MAARPNPKPPEGTISRAFWDSGRFRRLDERAERWGLKRCPESPSYGDKKWKRPKIRGIRAGWSEAAGHFGVYNEPILRLNVSHGGGSVEICTPKGYAAGSKWEMFGSPAALCATGEPTLIRPEECGAYRFGDPMYWLQRAGKAL